ncbi:hypothetical protein HK102_001893 [Quaeritorhiza haematococci]|nr:hypothetical protein HK102_001893 [Quaeritorhiza haematococci]
MSAQFAKKYLAQGRVVFPVGLKYDEKKSRDRGHPCKALDPPPPQGWQQLTMDSVGRSFRLNSLGLVTGPVSGVLAVDIDNMDLWKVLLDTLGESEPLTCRSISQRGAVHLLFNVTPALEAVRRKGVFGIKALGYDDFDILGQGDFLLVPPSSFETPEGRREYKFMEGYSLIDNPDKLIDAPEWLVRVLTRGSNEYRRVREAYLKEALSADRVTAEKVKGPDTNKRTRSASIVQEGLTAAEEALIALDTQDRLKEVEKHVKKLSADRAIDRQSWIEVGMAIHHATDGEGMELWDEFSRRAGPYDRDVLETQWDSFKHGSGITIGSLIHWGKEDSKAVREERKAAKTLEEKTKTNDDLRREVVKFGVDHTGGKGVFESWDDPKNLVAVIKNTMHHPDHRVECVFSSEGAFQRCLECGWRNPFAGELVISQTKYPVLHQQIFNITINNTVNHYYNPNEPNDSEEPWDDEAHLHDDYQPFDDPKLNDVFKRAFSGIDSEFGDLVYHLNRGTVYASGEDNTQWFKLKGFRWEKVEVGQVKDLMDQMKEGWLIHAKLREAHKWYLDKKNKTIAQKIFQVKNKSKTEAFMDKVIRKTCARKFGEGYEDFVKSLDTNKDLLAFNNGVYDLERGLFREGRPEDNISKSVGYDYKECPDHRAEVKDFFAKLFPDQELREYVFQYLASCLSGYTRDQMIIFGHGSGRNGKSKLLALMKETLGPDYASTTDKGVVIGQHRPDTNAVTHALNMLKGKRFAYISETVEGSKINESAFKTMSGEDDMFSRELYKEGKVTKPEFKLFLVCNHLPQFNAADEAMVRRIRVIPFVSQFVHPEELVGNPRPHVFPVDTSLDDTKLRSWRMALMGLLLEKYPEYKRLGIARKPALVAAMTKGYLVDNDPAKAYLQMECERVAVEESQHWVPPREFYRIFQTWCTENGFPDAARWGEKKCWEEFQKHGAVKERSRRGKENSQFIKGFQLLNRMEDE